jgi:reductive dehalogenase
MRIKLRRVPKVQQQEKPSLNGVVTAAEMYEVQSSYVRFNQKNNMGSQVYQDPVAGEARAGLKTKQYRLIDKGRRGYDRPAWSLDAAADSLLTLLNFSKNQADQGATSWQSNMPPGPGPRWEASAKEASKVVRKAAKVFGADQAGITRLDRRWVYSHSFDRPTAKTHPIKFSDEPGFEQYDAPICLEDGTRVIPKEMQYAVVMLHEWPGGSKGAEYAPTLLTEAFSTGAYARFAPTVWMLAEFIRGLGYNAIPCGNDMALSIPLAIDAGLGQIGRHSNLINPKIGSRLRISKVITDLPMEPDGARDFGITEFCDVCLKCTRKCGAGAIPTGERSFQPNNECNTGAVRLWMVDAKKCMSYQNRVGTTCSNCTRTCPWTKSTHWVHVVARISIKRWRWRWLNRFWLWVDDVLSYGKYNKRPEEFWADNER